MQPVGEAFKQSRFGMATQENFNYGRQKKHSGRYIYLDKYVKKK
jgi:hypothetical protein